MAYNLKEAIQKPNRMASGHRMCAGCGAPVVVNAVLRGLKAEDHAVIGAATGCLEVSSFIQRGEIHVSIVHLKMVQQQLLVQKQHINR